MRLAIVVPCYNEEAILEDTTTRLLALLRDLHEKSLIDRTSEIFFVDDGSEDGSWRAIESLSKKHQQVSGIKLSRNRGHQNALLAGLLHVPGDAVVSIDADLQDDVAVIEKMVRAYHDGSEVVYGVRNARTLDTSFKRLSAQVFYKLLRVMKIDTIYNHADFRLLSRRAVECLSEFRETNLFLRGIVPLIGLKSSRLYYNRSSRKKGDSKYSLPTMLALAIEGVTSFSAVPLRIIAIVGLCILAITIGMSIWVLIVKIFDESAVPGWASTVLPLYLLGGIQLFSIGIIGEYLMKIYLEVKGRPRFIIEKFTQTDTPDG